MNTTHQQNNLRRNGACPIRSATTGMHDVAAQRFGMSTHILEGIWPDPSAEGIDAETFNAERFDAAKFDADESDSEKILRCRLVIDEATGRIVGGTVYGARSHKAIASLQKAIADQTTENDLSPLHLKVVDVVKAPAATLPRS